MTESSAFQARLMKGKAGEAARAWRGGEVHDLYFICCINVVRSHSFFFGRPHLMKAGKDSEAGHTQLRQNAADLVEKRRSEPANNGCALHSHWSDQTEQSDTAIRQSERSGSATHSDQAE